MAETPEQVGADVTASERLQVQRSARETLMALREEQRRKDEARPQWDAAAFDAKLAAIEQSRDTSLTGDAAEAEAWRIAQESLALLAKSMPDDSDSHMFESLDFLNGKRILPPLGDYANSEKVGYAIITAEPGDQIPVVELFAKRGVEPAQAFFDLAPVPPGNPMLHAALGGIGESDVLVCPSLPRLATTLPELVTTVEHLASVGAVLIVGDDCFDFHHESGQLFLRTLQDAARIAAGATH